MTSPHLTAPASGAWRDFARAGAILILLLLQCAALDRGYSYIHAVSGPDAALWAEANTLLKWLVYGAVFGGVAFALSALASGRNFAKLWRESVERHLWGRWLAAEAACFAALYAMLPLFKRGAESPPWLAFALLLALGALMFACAALALAPLRFWRAFSSQRASAYWVSAGIGLLTFAALPLSQNSWTALSSATLHLSYWFLQLYEPAARMEADRFLLGAGDFAVLVRAACSGYEGIALVLGMMGAYIYAFRAHLRFPHVLLLLPIGVAAIWIFNALRIALLVSIGARISPQLALDGFHAQAGWVLFLAVTISLMAVAHQVRFFRSDAPARDGPPDPALKRAAALLAPFAALMAARIGGAITQDLWIGAMLIVLPVLAIFLYRAEIKRELGRINAEPWLVGLIVGALWIATEPAGESTLGAFLAAQPAGADIAWLALRLIGFVLIVPIAEELLFRGYLHRALISRRFETVAPGAFTWAAFLVTTLIFGAMHGRWLAGALAGAAFAFTLYRSNTLAGPIAAHVAANGLIAAWAVTTQEWALI